MSNLDGKCEGCGGDLTWSRHCENDSPGPLWTDLTNRLLGHGGQEVPWDKEVDVDLLLDHGKPVNPPVTVLLPSYGNSHQRAAHFWATHPDAIIVTGMALTGGKWVRHSWLAWKGEALETERLMDAYFGYGLICQCAAEFFLFEYIIPRHEMVSRGQDVLRLCFPNVVELIPDDEDGTDGPDEDESTAESNNNHEGRAA